MACGDRRQALPRSAFGIPRSGQRPARIEEMPDPGAAITEETRDLCAAITKGIPNLGEAITEGSGISLIRAVVSASGGSVGRE